MFLYIAANSSLFPREVIHPTLVYNPPYVMWVAMRECKTEIYLSVMEKGKFIQKLDQEVAVRSREESRGEL